MNEKKNVVFNSEYFDDNRYYNERMYGRVFFKPSKRIELFTIILFGIGLSNFHVDWVYIIVLLMIMMFISNHILGKIKFSRMLKKYPQKRDVKIFDNGIGYKFDLEHNSYVSFDKIIAIGETKNFIIIRLEQEGNFIWIYKKNIVGGTKDEVIEFLLVNSKNVEIKRCVNLQSNIRGLYFYIFLLILFIVIKTFLIIFMK